MTAIISYPSPNHAERLPDTWVEYLIIHYTACDLKRALEILTDRESSNPVSAHYVIDEAGQVYQLVDEERRAWHAGLLSGWKNRQGLNTWSIGIELVNPGHGPLYAPFPQPQMESLLALSRGILARYPIPPCNVLGHADIAPGRKIDPGELFDWQWLAQNGVGFYPPLKAVCDESAVLPDILNIQRRLQDIGYGVPFSGLLDPDTVNVIKAFQMHFLPTAVDGLITPSLVARLDQIKEAIV